MSEARKTIITCAVTGASLTPSMSKYLPVSPAEIAEQSLAAVAAGAAIVHLHAREADGRPTNDPAIWAEFVPRIRERSDAIINMSASLGPTAESRLEVTLAVPAGVIVKIPLDANRVPLAALESPVRRAGRFADRVLANQWWFGAAPDLRRLDGRSGARLFPAP